MSEVILRLENIVKTFPGTKALDGVSINLAEGEILPLLVKMELESTLMKKCLWAYTNKIQEILV